MKLSIWIINDWLEKYKPVTIIQEGKQSIEKIALFSSEIDEEDSTLFIGQMKDIFENTTSSEVILMHRQDVISLHFNNLEEIFNEVISAFTFYNKWEMKLLLEAQKDNPEQRIIDASKDIFGPMFLLDTELNVIALSKNYPKSSVNEIYDELIDNGYISMEQLKSKLSSWSIYHITERFSCDTAEERGVKNYNYGIVTSYLDDEDNLIGQLFILCIDSPTQKQIHLAHTIDMALSFIKNKKKRLSNNDYYQNFLTELLLKIDNNGRFEEFLLSYKNWRKNDKYSIVKFTPCVDKSKISDYSLKRIKQVFTESIITVFDDSISVCVNEVRELNYTDKLGTIISICGFSCGVSYTFTGLDHIYQQGKQASEALKFGKDHKLGIVHFSLCAFPSLLRNIDDKNYRDACLHPALGILKEYDYNNNTQFYQTLRVYLQYERSYLGASEKLSMHRNTIVLRIAKIQELLNLNLNSSEEREYLLFSFNLSADAGNN